MTPETENAQVVPKRVSILARLVPAMSYSLPALGAAISALLFIGVMRAMRNAESAGIAAVAGGISEANLAIVISLYLAIVIGFIGIVINFVRALALTTTAPPAGWLFLVMSAFGLTPMLALWRAESVLLDVLMGHYRSGVSEVAQEITTFLMLAPALAAVGCLILLVASVVPLPAALKAKRKWSPVIFLVIVELAVIGMTIAYHMRTYLFYQAGINERF
jgi:hypothetical protein